ncbi:phage tail spike protein [Weissella hellenica]|uniref:phage tail spike protein n=1 Tax=Weissella hellenica TaxID=46256 RepID=UPI003883E819
MIYIFDNKQKIIKVLTNEDLTAGHLDFKINTATTFEFSVPANKSLSSSAKFVAVPHPLDDSKFVMLRLTERTDNADTIDYSAYELAYQELATDGYIADKRPANQDALTLMKTALNGSNWELNNVNVAGTASTNFYYIDHLTAISKVVELLGGEIVFYVEIQGNTISGRYMDYLARQGEDTSKVFAKGSNLLTIERQSDTSGIYTAILPRGKGVETDGDHNESTPDGYGRRLNIADAVWKKSDGKPLDKLAGEIILYDPTANAEWGQIDGNYRLLLETYDDVDDVNTLINSAYKTLRSVNHPKIQYSATVADVGGLSLGDTVLIMHSDRKLSHKTRVFKVNYDLLDPAQTEISLGDDLSSNSITSQMNSVSSLQSVASEQTQWTINQVGRNPVTFGTVAPDNPKVGDTFFKYLPNGDTVVYEWNGEIWVENVSSNTGEQIDLAVDSAIETAKSQAAEMDEVRASKAAVFQSEANAALSSGAAERAVFSSNATSMASSAATHADSMASSAAAYGKAQAASALSSANSALTTAKSDLTTAIGQETENRNKAVAAVNSQAQDYATQAKSDAIEAAKTADGKVRKDFKETADALSSTISQNKEDSDGKISTAKTTATQALNGLSTKVSQSDYDKKTGDLSTAVNTVTQTANETKNELANVSKTVDSQSAKINTISNTVDGTTQTISDIKTEQGKQSGSIGTLQSRADGFDATVTKVNNLSVGGRNLYLDSKVVEDKYGTNGDMAVTIEPFDSTTNMWHIVAEQGSGKNNGIYLYDYGNGKIPNNSEWSYGVDIKGRGKPVLFGIEYGEKKPIKGTIGSTWSRISQTGHIDETDHKTLVMYFDTTDSPLDVYIKLPKLETGNTPTDWTPAPEDLSSATAKAQLTADNANLDLSTYKTDANGRISKAQSDITATANEVKTKVSQSDYDTKTNDLTTKYGQVKATADAVTTDVANYKKSNDGRIKADEANIDANSKAIALKVSQIDYDANNNTINGKFAQQTIDSNKILDSVTELQASVNSLGQVNQLMNSELSPDTENWEDGSDASSPKPYVTGVDANTNARVVGFKTGNMANNTYARFLQWISTGSDSPKISLSWESFASSDTTGKANIYLGFADSNENVISSTQHSWINPGVGWDTYKWENISLPSGTRKIKVSFEAVGGVNAAYMSHPMLVFGDTVGDYVAGNYNNNNRVASLELDIDGIHGLVDDPKNGMKATWDLASDGQSIAVKAQQDATTAITTAKGLQTTINDNKDDLQTQITATAKQVTTEMTDRANGDKSVRTDMANLIDQRVSSVTSGYQSAISQSADTIMASVSQPNQLLNTEFNPDLEGWSAPTDTGSKAPYRSYFQSNINATVVGFNTTSASTSTYARFQQIVQLPSTPGSGNAVSISWYANARRTDNYNNLWVKFYDKTGADVGTSVAKKWADPSGQNSWSVQNKWENITVPDTATSVQVSFQAREGTSAYLGHPMLVFGSTIGDAYMPGSYSGMNTSTVLELFKDNWALGIADNAGRLISGINGDKSGTVIQGKKLVINTDTIINGKAFIDGSVIKNASISTAQIGKAAIASAQIINVDVSKISGNIANFITGNISRLNSHVLYGDTGHLGTTDTGRVINKQDKHLQLASKGFYDSRNDRAQLELLSNASGIRADMKGSLNYYGNPTHKGHGLGIRLKNNQILAIDEDKGSKMLYLSPYQGGEVRVVSRDLKAYYPMRASSFNTMSSRSAKSDIVPFEDCALDIVKKTKIRTYVKSGKQEIGVISDEADPRMLTDDDNAVSLYDYTSILYKAVQELSEQVKELKNERPNN